MKAYEGTLPRGRYPAAVLFLTVADGAVDVNVHPAKEEVRFADTGRIFALIRQAVAEILSGYPSANTISDFFTPAGGQVRAGDEPRLFASRQLSENSLPPNFYEAPMAKDFSRASSGPASAWPRSNTISGGGYQVNAQSRFGINSSRRVVESRPSECLPGMQSSEIGFFSSMTVVGALWNAFIVLQSFDKCYLLDQHAAHERVIFEDLKSKRLGRSAAQRLLLPVQVECTPDEEAQAEACQELLNSLGFEFDSLGPRTLILQTVPMLVDGLSVETVFLETLADIASGGRGQESAAIDAMLARLACRMAVKANQTLSAEEIQVLLKKLDKTPLAHTCPHGRPFYFNLDRGEIEKRFQR